MSNQQYCPEGIIREKVENSLHRVCVLLSLPIHLRDGLTD